MKVNINKSIANGTVKAQPSKSYAHRLLIACALSKKESVINNIVLSNDILATINCIKALGKEVVIEGVKIFVTHGHRYDVKRGLGGLIRRVEGKGFNLVCYGHTHIQDFEVVNDIAYLNPGAFSYFKGGKQTFAVVEIEDGKFIVNM